MIESDANERLDSAHLRLARINEVETRFQKLNAALLGLPLAEPPAQRRLVRSGLAYLEKINESRVQGVKKLTACIQNELSSVSDGIKLGTIKQSDLVMTTVAAALQEIAALKLKASSVITRLEAGIENEILDSNQLLLIKNKKYKEKMPNLTGTDKEFAIARAPISFTFQNKEGHSSVGFVNTEMLEMAGFSVENLVGYTILHNQMVVGVNTKAIMTHAKDKDGEPLLDDNGKPVLVKKTVVEKVNKFKAGKPVTVKKRREMNPIDVAREIVKDIEQRTKTKYAFVSDKPAGENGAIWFWVMQDVDIKRLARAFPGKHIGISRWGFAWGQS